MFEAIHKADVVYLKQITICNFRVAALIVGDICDLVKNRDIVVQKKSGFLQHISELYPSYLSLQYPLIFSYADDAYNVDILHRGVTYRTINKRYYIRRQQHVLKCESYENLRNKKVQGTTNISNWWCALYATKLFDCNVTM
uniref:Uncharacterized protein n=1 Tax=Lactuca sativa TaxID=4236 RepID=A0A9R1UQJ7_LACSA|nr:hypothetical protein LSAT_V11C800416050 [Lactuca sativa]